MTRTILGIPFLLILAGCPNAGTGDTGKTTDVTNGGDEDGDNYKPSDGDCDDNNPDVNPGVAEACDGIDNNCDGNIDEGVTSAFYKDSDQDGFGDLNSEKDGCEAPEGYVENSTDCDDAEAKAYPGNPEVCDGIDNDCNGTVDDGVGTTYYPDGDLDGYGDPAAPSVACDQPSGYVLDNTDCDDTNEKAYPGNTETCDLIDNNCNGVVDEGVQTTYYADVDEDGYGDPAVTQLGCSLPTGYSADNTDCDDARAETNPGATEYCNGYDDNCNGVIDEDTASGAPTWYADTDSDGYGDPAASTVACSQPPGYVADNTDCLDTRAESNPGATEYCNGYDDDCDGTVDENDAVDASTWYYDADSDLYGNASVSTKACSQPAGYVADSTDCNDGRAESHPGATEYCNGYDDNCDGTIDEPTAVDADTWYADADSDTYGNAAVSQKACSQPAGYVADATDCDDARAATYPGATEYCNGIDDDCNGTIDDDYAADALTWYADTDSDAYGNAASSTKACSAPAGYVADATDCNDGRAATHPGASEYCNGIDDDCNGTIDDSYSVDASVWYADADSDTYGNASVSQNACSQPAGYVADSTDCNDTTSAAHPGATEICDGIDNDCDGAIDEDGGVTDGNTYYADVDADLFGDESSTIVACTQPAGYVDNYYDCDDADASEPIAVDDGGSASGTGSYSDPVDTVQAGIDLADECVVVWAGVYTEYDIDLGGKSLDLWGVEGYETTSIDAGLTTCDYSNPSDCHPVFDISSGSGAAPTIHGFSVSGGTGFMSSSSSSETCADSSPSGGGSETCTVTTYDFCGGGAYVNGDDPQFSDMVFSNNNLPEFNQVTTGSWTQTWVESMGGGVCAIGSNATFDGVVFASNYGDTGGGIYASSSSSLSLVHGWWDDNTALDGAGLAADDASYTVTNSVIACNAADTDGGAFFGETGGTSTFTNVVIAYNTAGTASTNGSQTYSGVSTSLTLYNLVAQANTASPMFYNAGTAAVKYADIKNAGAGGTTSGVWTLSSIAAAGTQYTSISCDADWTNDDASLRAGVASINAGDPSSAYNDTDGSRNDLGAYGGPEGTW